MCIYWKHLDTWIVQHYSDIICQSGCVLNSQETSYLSVVMVHVLWSFTF